jgi:hypothetical protein
MLHKQNLHRKTLPALHNIGRATGLIKTTGNGSDVKVANYDGQQQ